MTSTLSFLLLSLSLPPLRLQHGFRFTLKVKGLPPRSSLLLPKLALPPAPLLKAILLSSSTVLQDALSIPQDSTILPMQRRRSIHKSRGTLCSLISSYASFIRSQPSHASSPFPSFSCSLLVVSSLCLPHFRPPLITRASYVLLHRMPWCLHAP